MTSAPTFQYYDQNSLSAATYDFFENSLSQAAGSASDGDIDFYRELAAEAAGPILDIGTGTGRVAWALAADGHEVVGVDLAPAMLRQAEAKRTRQPEAIGGRVRFLIQDMTALALGHRFPLILVPFRSFNHLLSTQAQRQALTAMRGHLSPGGRLVLHLAGPPTTWHRTGLLEDTGGHIDITHPRTGDILRYEVVSRTADAEAQTVSHTVKYRVTRADGNLIAESTDILTLRWGTRQELRHLFELTGFAVEAVYGDFRRGPSGPDKEQVWLLRPTGD